MQQCPDPGSLEAVESTLRAVDDLVPAKTYVRAVQLKIDFILAGGAALDSEAALAARVSLASSEVLPVLERIDPGVTALKKQERRE